MNADAAAPILEREPRAEPASWPLWQRVVFRFFFVYLLLQIAPWNWLGRIPGLGVLTRWTYPLIDRAVRWSNGALFHVRDDLIPVNGSGDTSWAYAQMMLYVVIAIIACIGWSALDRRRPRYDRLGYWLRTIVRYYIAVAALSYGIIKLFALQMPFPTPSLLATPLGDLLPMRFSWLFIGYSFKYQFFSGLMETTAGVLLLFRRTVTLGLFVAAGAFANVVMINMSYDVPVKLFASHLLLACMFLLAWDAKRLFAFLVLNRPAGGTSLYEPYFTAKWQRWTALGAKLVFAYFILVMPFRSGWDRYRRIASTPEARPFATGPWEVRTHVVAGDTLDPAAPDSIRWRDVIFDNAGSGSIGTTDTMFWQRYRRGYFRFAADTLARTATFWRSSVVFDSTYLFTSRYEMPDSQTIRLWTAIDGDSVYLELARSPRHYQLTERQFHWLSEYNR